MPISALDGASAEHWLEVRTILTDAIEGISVPQFTVRIVSDADETGIIQKRIVQNVYRSDIVVCDVSGKNPNVMFELGMRLAFDKPVVIVKDDKTDYSFDTGIIEHLTYPRDLRFARIVEFKAVLAIKVVATLNAATSPEHSPFLKNFGPFHVATLSETEVSPEKLTLELLEDLRREVASLGRRLEGQPKRLRATAGPEESARLRLYVLRYLQDNPEHASSTLLMNQDFLRGAMAAVPPGSSIGGLDGFMNVLETIVATVVPEVWASLHPGVIPP
jgi:hypothetical protein